MRYTDITGEESPQELVTKLGILAYQKQEALVKETEYRKRKYESNTKRKTYNYWEQRYRLKHREVTHMCFYIKLKIDKDNGRI